MSTAYEAFSPGSTGTTATNPVTETEMREFFDRVTSSYATSFVAFSEQAKLLERTRAIVDNLDLRLANLEADNRHFEEDNSRLQKERNEFENDLHAANDYANKIRDEGLAELARLKAEHEAEVAALREMLDQALSDHEKTRTAHAATNGSTLEDLAATQRVLDETKAELAMARKERDAATGTLAQIRGLLDPPKPEPTMVETFAPPNRPFIPLT